MTTLSSVGSTYVIRSNEDIWCIEIEAKSFDGYLNDDIQRKMIIQVMNVEWYRRV